MTETTTPRDADGAKLCAWCGGAILGQSGIGRSRDYCSRTHREYAYRSRRQERLITEALAAARLVSTTDERGLGPDTSVDETRAGRARRVRPAAAGRPEELPPLAPEYLPELIREAFRPYAPAPEKDTAGEAEAGRERGPVRPAMPLPPKGVPRTRRRPLLPPAPGAVRLPLGEEWDQVEGEPDRPPRRDPQG